MPPAPARRRGAIVAAVALATVAIVAAAVLLARGGDGDEDPAARLRALPAVQGARLDRGRLDLRLRPGAPDRALHDVAAALPEDVGRGEVRSGPVVLYLHDTRRPDAERLAVAARLGTLRAPSGSIQITGGSATGRVTAEVDRPSEAMPLAREILRLIAPDDRWLARPKALLVLADDPTRGQRAAVSVSNLDGPRARATVAALEAAAALPDLQARVGSSAPGAELRVRAPDAPRAIAAWRTASRAVRRATREPDDVQVFSDTAVDEGGPEPVVRPVLFGLADDDPASAVATWRALGRSADRAAVATDGTFASAHGRDAVRARRAAATAATRRVRRVQVSWPTTRRDVRWTDGGGALGNDRSAIDERPARAVGLLEHVPALEALGVPGVQWDAQSSSGPPRLRIARPSWLEAQPTATTLRRFARAVRVLRWPGVATLRVAVGPDRCGRTADAVAVAEIRSTSTGPARAVTGTTGCARRADLATLRRAWDASR